MMAGKYTPLENYLLNLPARQNEITLDFDQIEGILNSNLPSSAYEDERWWLREKEANHVSSTRLGQCGLEGRQCGCESGNV